jgi:hypothetical protein
MGAYVLRPTGITQHLHIMLFQGKVALDVEL